MGIEAATATAADLRRESLARYAESELGGDGFALVPVSGDASFRRYFRIARAAAPGVIAMDAPPDREDLARFVRIAQHFAAAGLHVPQVLAADYENGFALLTDLGGATYLQHLERGGDPAPLYQAAIEALVRLQGAPDTGLPPYDAALLDGETELFRQWLLERHLGFALAGAELELLAEARERLTALALAQPRVTVHRDYHSRNLMVADPLPGIVDFQDAVIGPVTYDLVSLLEDCYVCWPPDWRLHQIRVYRATAIAAGIPAGASEQEFIEWLETMGIQRHLKAAGIFARLWRRDGKAGYLASIPRTLDYVVESAASRPAFSALGAWIAERVLPALAVARAGGR